MIYEEKRVSSEKIFNGKIVKLRVDKVEMPGGKITTREVVGHPGGVGIVAVTDKDEIILVRQHRYPIEKAIYEIPAGKLDEGEHHRNCGIRELEEETGYRAEKFEYLGFIYPSPGFTDEVTHVYFAEGLKEGNCNFDEDEFIEIEKIPARKVFDMVMSGEINDAKSVFGILKYMAMREDSK